MQLYRDINTEKVIGWTRTRYNGALASLCHSSRVEGRWRDVLKWYVGLLRVKTRCSELGGTCLNYW